MASYVFYKSMSNLDTILYADNIGLIFDANCMCKGRVSVIPDYTYRSVDVISLLQYVEGSELAYNIAGEFNKFTMTRSTNDVLELLNKIAQRPIFLGIRNLKINEVRGCQYIYVFRQNYIRGIDICSLFNV